MMNELAANYREKLKDPRWQTRRAEILARDKNTCTECGSTIPPLEVHHKYYMRDKEPWEHPDEALQTLCALCHDDKRSSGPKSLCSETAEAAVLGSMIVDPACILDVTAKLNEADFYHAAHRMIFGAIRWLFDQHNTVGVSELTLRTELERRGRLPGAGGAEYLQHIIQAVSTSRDITYFVEVVKEFSLRRSYIRVGREISEMAVDESHDIDAIGNQAEAGLFALAQRNQNPNEVVAVPEVMAQAYLSTDQQDEGGSSSILSGFSELDQMTCGFRGGDMVIIAGRPSAGKTALMLSIIAQVGHVQGKPVVIFSMEMAKNMIAERLLCADARIDCVDLRKGKLSAEDHGRLVDVIAGYQSAPIYISEASSLTPFELRTRARHECREHHVQLIAIDYLQLMGMGRRCENRQQEITEISRNIKSLARELQVPVIALSQLNRAPEKREDHKPQLADLRESGSIEQDADLVLLLHREDYYRRGEDGYEPDNIAEIIVAKQRNGPVGSVLLTFRERYASFADLPPKIDSRETRKRRTSRG